VLQFSGLPTLVVNPTKNNSDTYANFSAQASPTGNATYRRFLVNIGLTANGTAGTGSLARLRK
jgi:hypothetical protein